MHALHRRILSVNEAQSAAYVAAEGARQRYWATHRTFLACVKCMDGRVVLPVMTKTPVGIVKPFRAIGGRFEIFWPSFLGRVRAWVDDAMAHGSRASILLSYHFSASDPQQGCAGWHYDTNAARAHAEKLREQLAYVFGEELVPLVIGIETDTDAITLHGSHGDVSGAALDPGEDAAGAALARAMPAVPADVRRDLAPLLIGNAARVAELRVAPRAAHDLGHGERILAVGQGFDWLAEENAALIVNDADPSLWESIRVAAGILAANLRTAPDEAATLFTCIPYHDPGIDRRQAEVRARGLLAFAEAVVERHEPALMASGRLLRLAGVVWSPARRLEPLLSIGSTGARDGRTIRAWRVPGLRFGSAGSGRGWSSSRPSWPRWAGWSPSRSRSFAFGSRAPSRSSRSRWR